MEYLLLILFIVVIGYLIMRSTRGNENHPQESSQKSVKYERRVVEDNTPVLTKDVVVDVPPLSDDTILDIYGFGNYTKKERWSLEFHGGRHTQGSDTGVKVGFHEGYKTHFRREVCKSTKIISEKELIEFHQNYFGDFHYITDEESRGSNISDKKRWIKKTYIDSHKDKYDPKTKTWEDFDVNGVFMRVRGWMIDTNRPFPPYVWNLVSGNPFDRVFRVCRDYTKWKGTLRLSKILFDNVCKWESGEIFREGEPNKEFETPLWINWNKVGKVFLSLKTKLKKDSPEGLVWLNQTVGGYIRERKEFYDQFGKESDYYIQDELLKKYDELKVG